MAEAGIRAAQRMSKLVRHIERHLGERLTLAEMAAVVQLNPYHLAHLFKYAMGLAPHQYLIQRRVARAQHYLQQTDLPIAHVALAVGCANQSHFSALFHRATGMTPLAWRLRNRTAPAAPSQVFDRPPDKPYAGLAKAAHSAAANRGG